MQSTVTGGVIDAMDCAPSVRHCGPLKELHYASRDYQLSARGLVLIDASKVDLDR
jgi:hypothetical protein